MFCPWEYSAYEGLGPKKFLPSDRGNYIIIQRQNTTEGSIRCEKSDTASVMIHGVMSQGKMECTCYDMVLLGCPAPLQSAEPIGAVRWAAGG